MGRRELRTQPACNHFSTSIALSRRVGDSKYKILNHNDEYTPVTNSSYQGLDFNLYNCGGPCRIPRQRRVRLRRRTIRVSGGDEGTRTPYLRDANAALYQMSYVPIRNTFTLLVAYCPA